MYYAMYMYKLSDTNVMYYDTYSVYVHVHLSCKYM